MAEYNIKDTLETMSEYMGSQLRGQLYLKEEEFRVDELPTPSASIEGEIYQYMGDSTVDYQHSYFYECIALGTDPETYGWLVVNVQPSESGQTIQYDIMPTASSENEDNIIQYVGETTANYTNGYFYKCVAQGTDPETYDWQQTNVQPDVDISGKEDTFRFSTMPTASADWLGKTVEYTGTTIPNSYVHSKRYECQVVPESDPTAYQWVEEGGSTTDSRIGDEVTKIGIRIDDGFRPYISFDIARVIPEFSQVTPSVLKIIADEYYNGTISLADIQSVWSVGDVMEVQVSTMSASDGLSDTHAQQTIGLRIIDFLHDDLETAIGTKDKALLTLGMVDCLNEKGTMTVSSASELQKWSITPRRAWCNGTFYDALPADLRSGIKPVIKGAGGSLSDTITDRVFILTVTELGTTGSSLDKTGTKYAYYDDADSRKKKVNGSYDSYVTSNIQYTNSGSYSNGVIDNTGTNIANWQSFKTAYGLSMALCV